MATLASSYPALRTSSASDTGDHGFGVVLVSALTLVAVAVHGYHPNAEDGGLYLAGVKRVLDPALYPQGTEFVLSPMRHSLFAPLVANLARAAGWIASPQAALPWMLLGLYLATIWATLFAAWLLAGRCTASRAAQVGAVVLLACWLDLPIAGTALLLMDPYVTARSVSTPCIVMALVGTLDATQGGAAGRRRGIALCGVAIAIAAVVHPLMAAYAAGSVLVLICLRADNRTVRTWGTLGVGAAALVFAAMLQGFAAHERAGYLRVALTRTYWYLSAWAWYEVVGLVAPLVILGWFAAPHGEGRGWKDVAEATVSRARHFGKLRAGYGASSSGKGPGLGAEMAMARMGVVIGVCAGVVALLFARQDAATHLVARLQPLRAFQVVYLAMILAMGGWLGERALRRSVGRWLGMVLLLGGMMFLAARVTYPASSHLELPWRVEVNSWERAFAWIRQNTPKDALFAMDADYISQPGEDAQCFRAVAERSALPDYSKDGGEASIAPDLTDAWVTGQAAQRNLSGISDAERLARLRPLGVSWVVLQSAAVTRFECPYKNEAVQVCRLR